jgi:methylmalonyl-CoA mutase
MDTEKSDVRKFPPVPFDEFAPASYEEWKGEATAALKGAPFEKRLLTKTYEGITLEPIYTAEHTKDLTQPRTLPGMPDYLRGCDAAGYAAEPWVVAQGCDAVLPREANEILRRELERGTRAIHLILDGATRGCPDSVDPAPLGGRGLSLSSLSDLEEVLAGLDLGRYEVHVDAGASAAPLLGLFAARDQKAGGTGKLRGCIGADPLGTLAEEGTLPRPLTELYDEMARAAEWAGANAPGLRTALVRGNVYHDGGADSVRELGCAMATGAAYLEAMTSRGIGIDEAAGQIRFFFSLGANFFMEIAKLRAARLVWSQIVEAFGGGEEARRINLFVRTSRFTETVYDPYVNILRSTSQAFSGVVGGIDGMQVGCFDEAIRPGDELSRRVARNVQILLQNEFDLLQPIDPAGGSWYVETLTGQVAEHAWAFMQKVEAEGGMAAALGSGFVQGQVGKVLQDRLRNLAVRSDRAVGTNMYANMTEQPLSVPERAEIVRPVAGRGGCPSEDKGLEKVSRAKAREGCLVSALAEAFLSGATLGGACGALGAGASGETAVPIAPHRWTEQYEALRKRTEEIAKAGGEIRVFLANMGPIPQHKARADFSTGFMEVAGFKVLKNDGFATVEEALRAAKESGADVTVICSTDDTYPELVPPLAKGLKAECPAMRVLLAGAPAPEHKDAYVEAGVDDFIHVRANCLQILGEIQQARGMC